MNEMNEMDEMNEAIVMRYVDTANEVHEINEIPVRSQVLRGIVNICDTVVSDSEDAKVSFAKKMEWIIYEKKLLPCSWREQRQESSSILIIWKCRHFSA